MGKVKQYILENKTVFMKWLQKNAENYPYCCYVASDVLASYLKAHFNTGEYVSGEYTLFYPNGRRLSVPHSWVEVDGDIVDFTFIQFLENGQEEQRISLINMEADEVWRITSEKLKDGIFAEDKSLYKYDYIEPFMQTSYDDLAKGRTFVGYLRLLELNKMLLQMFLSGLIKSLDNDLFEQKFLREENKIGEGTTRDAYRLGRYVVKKHLHPVGFKQSLVEKDMYEKLKEARWEKHVTAVHAVTERYAIFDYAKALETYDDGTGYDIDCAELTENGYRFHPDEEEVLDFMTENGIAYDDIRHSANVGQDRDGFLVYIDYGMTEELYKEYAEGVRNGFIRQWSLESCDKCLQGVHVKYCGNISGDILCEACKEAEGLKSR